MSGEASPSTQAPSSPRAAARQPEIDVERLADRVYRLLVDEARLSRARGERLTRARRES